MRIATPLLCVGYADAMRTASGAARDRVKDRSGEELHWELQRECYGMCLYVNEIGFSKQTQHPR